ncbi:MAG: MtrB/PioB family outer membrane beta-barrel protein [Nitrospirae bacterium]|nr:MtrB/PioB family outer membrane beta-barrel protein [Nitrospirota bacterium]
MKKIIYLMILSLFIINKGYATQEEDDLKLLEELGIAAEEQVEYKYPDIKPEARLSLGYRSIDVNGPEQAFEYEYLKDFPVLGGEYRMFKYPHRLHADLDLNSHKDYHADLSYAYGDLFLSRWVDNTVFHNLDNIELVNLDPSSATYRTDRRDEDKNYGVRTGMNNLMLRLKTPDFPAHAYFRAFHVDKSGESQQRSLLGSGYYNDIERVTQERKIKWTTATYEVGANSHLGYAEVEVSHKEKRFDAKGDDVIFDSYGPSLYHMSGGVFPHNQVPELRGSANAIKIHSNYNQRVVASATFSLKEKENTTSGAKADIFHASGFVKWTPLTRLSFFVRYFHTDTEADNAGTASITDINGIVTTYPGTVKPSISKTTDAISIIGRYRPEPGVTLRVKYLFESADRDNAADWNLEETTRKNTLALSASLRVIKGLDLRTEYIHKSTVKPSYSTEPDSLDKGMASVSLTPARGVSLFVNYIITREQREDLDFSTTADARDRNTWTDNLMGSGVFRLMDNLSMTASYAYMNYRVKQDIVYGDVPVIDRDVRYEDMAHVYSASLDYMPVEKINILAMVTHVRSDGGFYPGSGDLLDPVSISSFSRQKIRETVYSLSGDSECFNSLSCGLEFTYGETNDLIDNDNDSNPDGHAYIVMLKFKKMLE